MGLEDDIQGRADALKAERASAQTNREVSLRAYDAELRRRWDQMERDLARAAAVVVKNGVQTERIVEEYKKSGWLTGKETTQTRHAADGWKVREDMYLDTNGRLWLRCSSRRGSGYKRLEVSTLKNSGKSQPYELGIFEVRLAVDYPIELYYDYVDFESRTDFVEELKSTVSKLIVNGHY